MITTFYLQNFKSFSQKVRIDLRDLTAITGPNSGGKSSIIQALLLLAQTLENPRPDVVLDLGGKYIQFAEFREASFNRPNVLKSTFSVGFELVLEEKNPISPKGLEDIYRKTPFIRLSRKTTRSKRPKKITNHVTISITFGADRFGTPLIKSADFQKEIHGFGKFQLTIERHRGKLYRVTQRISSKSKTKNKHEDEILTNFSKLISKPIGTTGFRIRNYWLGDLFSEPLNYFGLSLRDIPKIGPILADKANSSEGFGPINAAKLSEVFKDLVTYSYQQGTEVSSIQRFKFDHFLLPQTTSLLSVQRKTLDTFADSQMWHQATQYDRVFGKALSEIREFFSQIRYIGPLRAKPERAYLALGTPVDIGNAGENAVPILWLYQNDKVLNLTTRNSSPVERRLVDAVQDWMHEFGIGSDFHITKPKRVIYQAELESSPGSNTMVTIADVGFGVSQILPVFVAGLRAPKGSTLIFEQPEIHLHPRLQGKLADFLLCLVSLGKRVVVETHSEHLVNMLRLRIIEDKTNHLQHRVGIIFVRSQGVARTGRGKGGGKKGSHTENLKVDKYGRIVNWPPDFFPETSNVNEEILKAMINRYPG